MFSFIWREGEWNYWALKHKGIFDSWQFTHLKVGKKWERRYRLISFSNIERILKEWRELLLRERDGPVEKLFKCRLHRRSPPALLFGTLSLDFRSLFLDIRINVWESFSVGDDDECDYLWIDTKSRLWTSSFYSLS